MAASIIQVQQRQEPFDESRLAVTLGELPPRNYENVLHIGCGNGQITRRLPGRRIVGLDQGECPVTQRRHSSVCSFVRGDIFDLPQLLDERFDFILISDILNRPDVRNSLRLIYLLVDNLLEQNGILVCDHEAGQYIARFPYLCLKTLLYNSQDLPNLIEVYAK
jgi:trans-aconitate methyltransferase